MRFREFAERKQDSVYDTPKLFTDINGELNMLDYVLAVEAEMSNKPLSEDIDRKLVNQIEKMSSLAVDNPKVGEKYIPAFVFYVSDKQVRVHGSATPLELLEIENENGSTVYNFGNGKRYPDKRLSNLSYSRLFLFDNKPNFNKFMDVMSLRFNVSQLSESKQLIEAKVGREYQHLEDLVFVDGSEGAIRAADILDKLGEDSSDVSIKWDGLPAIYWGRDENGEFVLTGINGWGKEKVTSAEELYNFIMNTGKGDRSGFAQDMANVYKIMEPATPDDFRGYIFGDLLWHPGNPYSIDDGKIKFTPNAVEYTVTTDSELGKRIANSSVGVVAHLQFNEFGSKSGKPVGDVDEFNSKEAVVLGPTYVTHQPEVDTTGVDKIRQDAKKFAPIIDEFLEPRKGLSDMKNIIYTYVNQKSKAKQLNTLETGFFDWLETSKVSPNKQKKIAELAKESPKALPLIFRLVKEIMTVKDHVIDQFDSADSDVKASTAGQKGGEGYVAQGSKTKLVPRTRWQPK